MNPRQLCISFCTILVLLLAFSGTSCNPITPPPQRVADAKNVAQTYYESIKASDFEKAATFCSMEINGVQVNMTQYLRDSFPRMGELLSYKFDSWRLANDRERGNDTLYALVYKLTYSKAKTLENLFFWKDGDELKITGIGDTTQYNDEQWPAQGRFNW